MTAQPNPHEAATELVARARAGDHSAFDELVRRYRPRIFALALHITGNRSDADDVSQEVFLRAYRSLERFEGRSQFFTWVYRMAVNSSLNACRSRRRRRETHMEDPRLELAVEVDAAGNPGQAAALRQIYSRLLAALDRLPSSMRTTIVLVILQGLSHAEAAIIQRCPVGTVAWRVFEARRRLRLELEASAALVQGAPSRELAELLQLWGWPVLAPF